jgi:hypothetical protein
VGSAPINPVSGQAYVEVSIIDGIGHDVVINVAP